MWDAIDDSFKNFWDSKTCTSASVDDVGAVATDEFDDLIFDFVGHSARHVHFVEYGYDFEVVVYSLIKVGYSLCLNALSGVDDKKCAFASGDGARYFV